MITWLDDNSYVFPLPQTALKEPDGLLAAGGDLSPQRLVNAYANGIFPWYNPGEPILWWSPDPRCVLFPADAHLSRSLKKAFIKTKPTLTFDKAFDRVISQCAKPRQDGQGTWISDAMNQAYNQLHQLGFAHSIEVWQQDQLVGGLYGVSIGPFFFGESMFSRAPNASKFALFALAQQCKRWNYELIDCQVSNPHLFTMGAQEVPRQSFLNRLDARIEEPISHDWSFDDDLLDFIYHPERA